MKGVRSRTRLYQVFYDVFRPLLPVLRRFFPGAVTTTVDVGQAMLNAVRVGYARRVLETADINELARGGGR